MNVEPRDLGATLAGDGGVGILAGCAQAKHAAAAARACRNQALHGGVGQLVEQRGLAVVASLLAGEQTPDLATDGPGDSGNILVAGCGQRVEEQAAIGLSGPHAVDGQSMEVNVERKPRLARLPKR